MDRIIEIKVNGSHLTKDNRTAGVQHEGNAKTLRIEFDPGWDGYAKKVTFWDATGGNPVERTLTADLLEKLTDSTRVYLCKIPPEPMAEAGEFTFVIDGYADGVRQRSVSDTLVVKAAPFIEKADEPQDPTPTQAEQLQVQIDTLLEDIREEAIRAEDAANVAERSAEEAKDASDAAVKAQKAVENMTVTSETLPAGSMASVQKSVSGNVVNLHFGIPRGDRGAAGSGGGEGGGGDMYMGTYDPTGKEQDIFAYADKAAANAATQAANEAAQRAAADVVATVETVAADVATAAAKTAAETAVANADVKKHASRHAKNGADPIAPADIGAAPANHAHTAADVGALPLNPGSAYPVQSNLYFNNGAGRIMATAGVSELAALDNRDRYNSICVKTPSQIDTEGTVDGLVLANTKDGATVKTYRVYGEYNKPVGSYTGNGSATTRVIDTGGSGNAIVIWNGATVTFVALGGAIYKSNSSAPASLNYDKVQFVEGVLTLNTNASNLNASGTVYQYQVL